MLLAAHFARPVVGRVAKVFRSLPRTGNGPLDSVMNMLSAEPRETAAVLHGILAGPIAPTVDQRAAMEIPALVIGHKVDHVHPFHDAEQLARRLPQGQLIQASSVLELRVHPERLTEEINRLPRPRVGRAGAETAPGQATPGSTTGPLSRRGRAAGPASAPTAGACRPGAAPWPPWTAGSGVGSSPPAGPRQPLAEPLDGQLPVAQLRPLVVDHHPDLGTQLVEEPGPLVGPERRRPTPRRSAAPPGSPPCWRAGRRGRRSG